MPTTHQHLGEEFLRLALAIEQHLPGYVDSYFGPDEWMAQAKQNGKVPLRDLTEGADRLATDLSQAGKGTQCHRMRWLSLHCSELCSVQTALLENGFSFG